MSRNFNGTTDKAVYVGAPFDFSRPFGIACWFSINAISGSQALVCAGSTSTTVPFFQFFIGSGSRVAFQWRDDANVTASATGATTLSAGVWNFTACAKTSNTQRSVWLNGVGRGDSTVSLGNMTTNRFSIGNFERTTPLNYFGGMIANVCLWDLTDWGLDAASRIDAFEQAQSKLALGANPQDYWQGLIACWPLNGNQSPEPDSHPRSQNSGNYPLTLTGTTKGASNPPIAFNSRTIMMA